MAKKSSISDLINSEPAFRQFFHSETKSPSVPENENKNKGVKSPSTLIYMTREHHDTLKLALTCHNLSSGRNLSMGRFIMELFSAGFKTFSPDGYDLWCKIRKQV